MQKTARILLAATIALAPQAAALVPDICDAAPLPGCPLPVIGDTTVQNGETRTYSGAPHLIVGTIVVADGGVLVLEDGAFTFAKTSGGILVLSGGHLHIAGASLDVHPTAQPLIDAEAGSGLELVANTLDGVAVRTATNATTLTDNVFANTPHALDLTDVSISVLRNEFHANELAISANGGSPTISSNQFYDAGQAMDLSRAAVTVDGNLCSNCVEGATLNDGLGRFSFNNFDDREDPVHGGLVVLNAVGHVDLSNNHLQEWGTGIHVKNSPDVTLTGNTFQDNLQDILIE